MHSNGLEVSEEAESALHVGRARRLPVSSGAPTTPQERHRPQAPAPEEQVGLEEAGWSLVLAVRRLRQACSGGGEKEREGDAQGSPPDSHRRVMACLTGMRSEGVVARVVW